jgi:hypothetical protein
MHSTMTGPMSRNKPIMGSVGLRAVLEDGSKTSLQAPLAVMGKQNEKWALNRSHLRANREITVKEIVDNLLHKPAFGFENYNPKPTHKDLIPPISHKQQKSKRTTFAETIGIEKSFVPASTKY